VISSETFSALDGFCEGCYIKVLPTLNEMTLKNIRNFAGSKAIEYIKNGKIIFACYLSEMTTYDDHSNNYTVFFGEMGLKRKDNLLGLAGFFYDAKSYFSATPEKVIEAWKWFNELTESTDEYWQAVEAETVWNFFKYSWRPFNQELREIYIANILSLVNDLHTLWNLGVDIAPKLLEIKREKMEGNMKAFQRLANNEAFHVDSRVTKEAFLRIRKLRQELANLSSEARLAVFAAGTGFEVKMLKSPDLLINNKRIEVKCPKVLFDNPRQQAEMINGVLCVREEKSKIEDLGNSIRNGFNQKADIVAIEVNHLEKRPISVSTKWLGAIAPLNRALNDALCYQKHGIVLLFKSTGDEGWRGRVMRCKIKSAKL
jgi:hypothetical protein